MVAFGILIKNFCDTAFINTSTPESFTSVFEVNMPECISISDFRSLNDNTSSNFPIIDARGDAWPTASTLYVITPSFTCELPVMVINKANAKNNFFMSWWCLKSNDN